MAQKLKLLTLPAVTVATAGTSVPVHATNLEVYGVLIVSLSTNTGTQYIGDSDVDSTNGMPFFPDGSLELEVPENMRATDTLNLADIYVDSSTNDAEFRIVAWVRG